MFLRCFLHQADFVLLEKQSSLRDTINQQRTHMLETENECLRLDLGVHQENASRLQAQVLYQLGRIHCRGFLGKHISNF